MARRDATALSLLTVVALALRLVHLGRFELWVDEAATWWFSRMVWHGDLASAALQEPTPPVYYALLGLLTQVLGESDWVLRLPSALAGAAAVPAVYWLGWRLFEGEVGRRVGWVAALFLAVHPLHVFYSREARVYTLLLLLTTLLFLALWRGLETERWRAWWPFTLVLTAICALHVSGYFLGVAVGLQILLCARGWRGRRQGLVAAAVAGLALLPYTLWALPQMQGTRAAWSVENLYRVLPEEGRLGRTFEMQLLGADYFVYLRQMDKPPTPQGLRWLALLAQLGLLAAALRWGAAETRRRPFALLLVGWMASILVPWTLSRTWQVFYHPGRHDFYTVGIVMVVLGVGFEGLRSGLAERPMARRLALGGVLLVLGLGVIFRLWHLHTQPPVAHYRPKGEWLAQHAEAGRDRVIATGILRPITEHYTRLAGNAIDFESFPAETDQHAGWSDDQTLIDDPVALEKEARSTVERFSGADGPERLFLLLRPYQRQGDAFSATWLVDRHLLQNLRRAGWRPVDDAEAKALWVEIYERP